ncbi:hypothetical protein GCM10007938_19220 [Vibrio zhanjiangensis]|uniref:Uncharacterized protein n=1 Tax=Vibrio zhanjiangensis TaxID=1046128 RepID=A0ABQ6EYT8_9VIBR|nr:hypothetical protein GCM10007938_19220 [Vibrio zhanjiangensis]
MCGHHDTILIIPLVNKFSVLFLRSEIWCLFSLKAIKLAEKSVLEIINKNILKYNKICIQLLGELILTPTYYFGLIIY